MRRRDLLFDLYGFNFTAEATKVCCQSDRDLLIIADQKRAETAVRLTLADRPCVCVNI